MVLVMSAYRSTANYGSNESKSGRAETYYVPALPDSHTAQA